MRFALRFIIRAANHVKKCQSESLFSTAAITCRDDEVASAIL
jgi:hypothetical protein